MDVFRIHQLLLEDYRAFTSGFVDVRQAAGEIRRGLSVTAQHPADGLGFYVYIPVAGAS